MQRRGLDDLRIQVFGSDLIETFVVVEKTLAR